MLDQELANWKRTQRLCAQEEMPDKKELDQLQQWCEQLAELLWRNRIQILQVSVFATEYSVFKYCHLNEIEEPTIHFSTVLN